MPEHVTEARLSRDGLPSGGHSHSSDSRCFGLCRPALCGISWAEIIGATVLALPVSLWYRSFAIPWLHKSGVVAEIHRDGISGGLNKFGAEIGPALQKWSKTFGGDMNKWVGDFLLWVASNPLNFLIVGVAIVGVVVLLDWTITSLCAGGHSHSHSHSHGHGHSHGSGKPPLAAESSKLARELQRVDTEVSAAQERDAVRKEAEAAGAKVIKPSASGKPGTKKPKTQEDVRGTVKAPSATAPKYSAFHVKDPILMLKRFGKWPPPASTIIGGTPEAIEAAREAEKAQLEPSKQTKKSKTTRKAKKL